MEKNLGKKIRELRIEKGMTQLELALKVGYRSKQAVTKIENGDNDISSVKVRQFADALGVPIERLLGLNDEQTEEKARADAMVDVIHDKYARELVEVISGMSVADKKHIIAYARFYAGNNKE